MSNRIVFMDLPKTRVFLSPAEKGDLEFFRRALNNERISRFLVRHDPVLECEEEEWFVGLAKRKANNRHCSIILKETQEVIGSIALHNIEWVNRTATTGTFIGREDLLGQGLGSEAKMLLLKHAFIDLNLRQVYSRVYAFNTRSQGYAKKCGYREIARYPQYIFRDGEFHDLVHFLVWQEEWLQLWQKFEKENG